jgi:hypothetical protein
MDPSAFDTLVRSFATIETRRRVLARLAALLPVAGLGGLRGEDAAAWGRCHGRHRSHHPGTHKDHRKGKRKGHHKDHTGGQEDDCGGCPQDQVCCGSGQSAACCDPRSCCLPEGGGGGLSCCPRPTCCLTEDGPICCLGICEVDGSGNFVCR